MERFKLFGAFIAIGFVSLFKPEEGRDMVECALLGANIRSTEKTLKAYNRDDYTNN